MNKTFLINFLNPCYTNLRNTEWKGAVCGQQQECNASFDCIAVYLSLWEKTSHREHENLRRVDE